MTSKNLEDALAKPIKIPENPFLQVLKTFGRDELYALGLSMAGTGALELMISEPPTDTQKLALAAAGPIIEKAGFFIGHFMDAHKLYHETPETDRKSKAHYLWQAVRGGGKSLIQDILVHDPLYVGLMLGGMSAHPQTPPWLLVPVAFGAAVLAVAAGEVTVNEARYRWLKRKLRKSGFGLESYLESRFYLPEDTDQDTIMTDLKERFVPNGSVHRYDYFDRYLPTTLPTYNARAPRLRLRRRGEGNNWHQSVQIIYTRAAETSEEPEQFRFFPTRKDKHYYLLEQAMPQTPADIQDPRAKARIERITGQGEHLDVHFKRTLAHHPNEILVSVDEVDSENARPYTVVELKAYETNMPAFKQAMRYVMRNYPVLQTTHAKSDLHKG